MAQNLQEQGFLPNSELHFMNSLSTKIHLCEPPQIPGCEALIGEASSSKFKNVGEEMPDQLQPSKGWKVELTVQYCVYLSIADKWDHIDTL